LNHLENGLELFGDSCLQWNANYRSTQAADGGAKASTWAIGGMFSLLLGIQLVHLLSFFLSLISMIFYHQLRLLYSCLNEEKEITEVSWCFWNMEIIARYQFLPSCLFNYETSIFCCTYVCGNFSMHISPWFLCKVKLHCVIKGLCPTLFLQACNFCLFWT
jgi:hypothetical protein